MKHMSRFSCLLLAFALVISLAAPQKIYAEETDCTAPAADISAEADEVTEEDAAFYPMDVESDELEYADSGAVCTMGYTSYANEETIYNFIVNEIGYTSAAACGMLANIYAESKFDPLATGDNGTSHGITQWHKERWTSLVNWCSARGYDCNSLSGQLAYLKYEVTAGDTSVCYNCKKINSYMSAVPNTMQGCYDAGYFWCYYYERPAAKETSSVKRGNTAKNKFWPVYMPYIFVDVTQEDWFFDAVDYCNSRGIMTGMSHQNYSPYTNLVRAQFAVILYRMSGSPSYEATVSFADVRPSDWYYDAVMWAASVGIVKGYSHNNFFGAVDPLTREQLAVMMMNYLGYRGVSFHASGDLSAWPDAAKVQDYSKISMIWAVSNGIITGKGDGTLSPGANASRAECAIVLMRFMMKYFPQ